MWFEPRSRSTDPDTSHFAANLVGEFDHKHTALIMLSLRANPFGMGAHEIAKDTGLTQQQVCRRLPEMEREGIIWPSGTTIATPTGRRERVWIAL